MGFIPKSWGKMFKKAKNAPNEFQQATTSVIESGGEFKAADYMKSAENAGWLEKNGIKEMQSRVNSERESFLARAQGAKDQAEFDKLFKEQGIEGATRDNFVQKVNEHFGGQLKDGPSVHDYFKGNHGYGITATGVAGASVISMASSRGRKSNSELYSDPFRG